MDNSKKHLLSGLGASETNDLEVRATKPQVYTHNDLVELAAKWLRKKHSLVITEIACVREEPDALGFDGPVSTLIECKASRADFLSDDKKWYRRKPSLGLGDYRFYLVPSGLVNKDEIPETWGLLCLKNGRIRMVKKAKLQTRKAIRQEMSILLSIIRRIGQTAPEGVSIRFYVYQTDNRTTVGMRV